MRIMVTGGRDWRDIGIIRRAIERIEQYNPDESKYILINGCASGADAIARAVAVHLGWDIEDYWPDYVSVDFATANKERNCDMVDSGPDVILAFPTPRSRGTWHAIHYAESQGYHEGADLIIHAE